MEGWTLEDATKGEHMRESEGLPEAEMLQSILLSISQMQAPSEHFQALQVICESAREIYLGLLHLIAQQLGLPAQALARTLFETVVSGVLLARQPEKLEDFRNHGKYTQLRTLHFSEFGLDEKSTAQRKALQAQFAPEIAALFAEFGDQNWHKLTAKKAFVAAGFSADLYDKYYRPASAIAHGQPHAMVETVGADWKFSRSGLKNAHQTIGTYVVTGIMLLHFLAELNEHFKLGIESSLSDCNRAIQAHKEAHYEVFRSRQRR
jgi:hypothetical protein